MDKSRVCIDRTINLAKGKKCEKTNILVYEKPRRVDKPICPPPTHVPRIAAIPAKRIRVCTGAELKKICPPKLCDCQPRAPLGFLGSLCALLGLGLKAVVATAALYLTYDAGIWGDSEQTQNLYMDVCQTFVPVLCPPEDTRKPVSDICEVTQELMCVPPPPPPICCDKMPIDHERGGHYLAEKWNGAVSCLFGGIANFPDNLYALIDDLREKAKERSATKRSKKSCD